MNFEYLNEMINYIEENLTKEQISKLKVLYCKQITNLENSINGYKTKLNQV